MDFRVSVLPTIFGEKVVLRLLDKSNLQLDMTKLGFEERALDDFKEAIYKPFGMVLVTGPTGSGKTTTLYSALAELNKVATNISTAEDPVEFNLVGINQVQMHEEIGLNFAAALRAFLRQDPDIIMVGEIRDFETAEIAVKAALTGHLVLSTLHTNDAPSTDQPPPQHGRRAVPGRVVDQPHHGAAPGARRSAAAARRTRRSRPRRCSTSASPAERARTMRCYRGAGCSHLRRHRLQGPHRALRGHADDRRDPRGGARRRLERRDQARRDRQRHDDAAQSGINKIAEGVTTVEEVLRVTMAD